MKPFFTEACVETFEQAVNAQKNGADRIELCSRLDVGGMTPSEDLLRGVHQRLNIPVRVMIRPRPGNFTYSKEEIAQMEASIDLCKHMGVEGVVFGVLKADNTLDLQAIANLISKAAPLKVVIHKAIDETPNLEEAIQELLEMEGVHTILTSAGYPTAQEGKVRLKELHYLCGEHIELMPAGKITSKNLSALHAFLGAGAYHGRKIVGDL